MVPALLLGLTALSNQPTGNPPGERYALIIGIDSYNTKNGLNQLQFACNDAISMYQVLAKHGGFKPENMILLTSNMVSTTSQPLYDNIVSARLEMMQNIKKPEDLLFVYVAGHGFTLGGSPMFPAMDARWGNELVQNEIPLSPATYKYMDASYFLSLDSLKARNLIAVFDMCRNEPLASRMTSMNSRNVMDGTLANALRQTRVIQNTNAAPGGPPPVYREMQEAILMSCQIGQTSIELPSLQRGAFSHCFSEAFRKGDANKDKVVSLSEAVTYVEGELAKQTAGKQIPTVVVKGSSMNALPLSLTPTSTIADLPLPSYTPNPEKKLESEKGASGKIRQTVSSFTDVYSIVPTNTGYELTSGEGGFTARIPLIMQKDPTRKEPETIVTPDGNATLIGYGGEDRTHYDFSTFGAYYFDYPVNTKKEKDLLKWAESWLKDKSNTSIFQKELDALVRESMDIDEDIWKVTTGDILSILTGGLFGNKKKPKAVLKAENYDIAGSPGRRIQWTRVPDQVNKDQEKEEPGSRGFVTVQIGVVGNRIYLLKEGFALDKEEEGNSRFALLKKFIRSFDFID